MHAALAAGPINESSLLPTLVIVLVAAGLVAVLLQRIKLATIPAYLFTGSIIGPGAFGIIDDPEAIESLGSLATVFLLFGIGLHLDFAAFRGVLGRLVIAGAGSTALSALLLWPVMSLIDLPIWSALAAALALSVSSTAVVLRMLQARRLLQRMSGKLSLGILIVQDIVVIAIIILLPALARLHADSLGISPSADAEPPHAGPDAPSLLELLPLAIAAVVGIVVVGRFAVPYLLSQAAKQRSTEISIVITAAFAMAAAATAAAAGLSAELGAFIAGLLLASSPFRSQVSGQIGVIRDLFIAVFFTIIGTAINYSDLIDYWPAVLIATAALVFVKAFSISLSLYSVGAAGGTALIAGFCLAQGSEFGLVILSIAGGDLALLDDTKVSVLTAAIALSLVVAPLIINLTYKSGEHINISATAPWVHTRALVDPDSRTIDTPDAESDSDEHRPHIVVAGFGVVGRAVIDSLRDTPATIAVIEMNPATVASQRRAGRNFVFGDSSNPEVLEQAGIHHASVLVLTIPDEQATLTSIRQAKRISPDVAIVARTSFMSRAMLATALGAETVVEEIATAREMVNAVNRSVASFIPKENDAQPPTSDESTRDD